MMASSAYHLASNVLVYHNYLHAGVIMCQQYIDRYSGTLRSYNSKYPKVRESLMYIAVTLFMHTVFFHNVERDVAKEFTE